MPNYGFGYSNFGNSPFGGVNWCKIVLYDEMPESLREQDAEAGYPYRNFIDGMCPNFEWLRKYIQRFKNLTDPWEIRKDLLQYFAMNFGIDIDLAEPEQFQRMRSSLAARWNIIKGTVDSYVVLCRVHGFEVNVIPLWWDGENYQQTEPHILNETPTYTITDVSGDSRYRIWLKCSPCKPSTFEGYVVLSGGGGTVTFQDDGSGIVDVTAPLYLTQGTIDYGWGYVDFTLGGTRTEVPIVSYTSIVGGCNCVKCKTNKIQLQITPGTIGGQNELTITEAFQRLYEKLGVNNGNGVIPVHVELYQIDANGSMVISIGNRYDILPADDYVVDTGLRWEFVS